MRAPIIVALCLTVAGLSPAGDLMADSSHDHHAHHTHDGDAEPQSPLTRARHLQRHHEFSDAAALLVDVLEREPLNREAQLLYADVLLHDGRIDEARAACVRVGLAGAHTLAGYCGVQVLSAAGEHDDAYAAATRLSNDQLSEQARIWALEIAAIAAWKAGQDTVAKAWFDEATAYPAAPHSTTDAYDAFVRSTE